MQDHILGIGPFFHVFFQLLVQLPPLQAFDVQELHLVHYYLLYLNKGQTGQFGTGPKP